MSSDELTVFRLLTPVRKRQRRRKMLNGLKSGLCVAAVLCLIAGIRRWQLFGPPPPAWQIAVAMLLPTIVGTVIGGIRRCSWLKAARAVDACGGLKDQASSAVAFQLTGASSPLHALQHQQTIQLVRSIDVTGAVERMSFFELAWPCGLTFASAALWIAAQRDMPPLPAADALPNLAEVTALLHNDLLQLQEISRQAETTDLDTVLDDFKQHLQGLQNNSTSLASALEDMSAIQQSFAARQAQFNLALTSQSLQAAAEAMSEVGEFRKAAELIQQQEFSEAARSLEKLRPRKLDPDESARAAARLAEVAAEMQNSGLDELSDQVDRLSQSLQQSDGDGISESNRQLARTLDQQQRDQDLADLLQAQIERFADYKNLIRKPAADTEPSDSDMAAAEKDPSAAADESSGRMAASGPAGGSGRNAGAGSTGPTTGRMTSLESRRQLARLTGQLTSRGSSVRETVSSSESDQKSQRSRSDVFAEYQRRSQNAVRSEKIPLAHRQSIQRYFESLNLLNDSLDDQETSNLE